MKIAHIVIILILSIVMVSCEWRVCEVYNGGVKIGVVCRVKSTCNRSYEGTYYKLTDEECNR